MFGITNDHWIRVPDGLYMEGIENSKCFSSLLQIIMWNILAADLIAAIQQS